MEEQEKQAVKQTPADLYLMVPKIQKRGCGLHSLV